MVLCLDTLGLNTSFEESQILQALELCKAAGQRKSQSELKEVDAQALIVIDEAHRESQMEQITGARAAAEEVHRQALAQAEAQLGDSTDVAKDAVEKRFVFTRAAHTAKELTALILSLKSWVVVPAEVVSVVAGAAMICGRSLSKVYDKRNVLLPWDKLKHVLDESLFHELTQVEMAGKRSGLAAHEKLSFLKKLAIPDGLDEEKAFAISPAFGVLFAAVQAACLHRHADLELRKAQWQAAKEEASAEGAEYTGPPLTDMDDDYVE